MNRLRNRRTLEAALAYAIYDRQNSDYFCDWLEMEHTRFNSATLIDELIEELCNPASYTPRVAFAYFPPKNELCDRRLIYLPIKDLTVRYAFALVCSEEIEAEIHPGCFANRRATGPASNIRFTEDFATGGWARFCTWQRTQSEQNSVLLKTDISSFYDSVSHEYLVDAICRHLQLPPDCDFIQLFRRFIQVPVVYYSPRTGEIENTVTHQGLPLGDGVEGYLANLYLKDVDDAMTNIGAFYGRYVDDIRLFGDSRETVILQLRILQEQLLRKGLNLNSSKTEIAENEASQRELMPRLFHGSDYQSEEDDAGNVIAGMVDPPLEEFSRTFTEQNCLERGKDAKDFCKFLSAHQRDGRPMLAISNREIWHVERLREIITTWRGPTKHAAWLLVQTATCRGVNPTTNAHAIEVMMSLIHDNSISSYARYRLVHHLLKLRQGRAPVPFRFIQQLSPTNHERLAEVFYSWLSQPAFELNLIGLYGMRVWGATIDQMRTSFAQNCRRGCSPVRNSISALAELPSFTPVPPTSSNESDESPSSY